MFVLQIQDETSGSSVDAEHVAAGAAVNPAYDDSVDPDTGQPAPLPVPTMNIGAADDEPKLNNLDNGDDRHRRGDECKLRGGCPLSVQEEITAGNDQLQENNHEDGAGTETEALDDDNVKETAILDDEVDSVRETAILDDNTSDDNLSSRLPSRKPSMKKDIDGLNLPSSKSKMDGIYGQLGEVKETAILDSEDGLSDDDDDDVFVDSEEGPDMTGESTAPTVSALTSKSSSNKSGTTQFDCLSFNNLRINW